MELKTLILGLVLSTAAFSLKAGGGLGYLFLQTPGMLRKALVFLAFMAVYAMVFLASAAVLTITDLTHHIDLLQAFFKSGMVLHFILALLLVIWGVKLLLEPPHALQASRGWIPLVAPCPICFSVVLLSCSFVSALYPGSSLVFVSLYAGFILISLCVALVFALVIRHRENAGVFLGSLMLYIAGYFLLSVIIIPQFADLERIYRISISLAETVPGLTREKTIVVIICLAALGSGVAAGPAKPFKRE